MQICITCKYLNENGKHCKKCDAEFKRLRKKKVDKTTSAIKCRIAWELNPESEFYKS